MPNELDEMTGPVNEAGRDVAVIEKQIPVKVGAGSTVFTVLMWVLGIIPGLILLLSKVKATNYLRALQQKIQANASTIDNFIEQRVVVLTNAASLLNKAIDYDKSTLIEVTKYRGTGKADGDAERNAVAEKVENVSKSINVAFEAYPDLKAHKEIQDCMQQNSYLQREITAAREVYNDSVSEWNQAIFQWPAKQMVAAKQGYTTRIPFSVSKEVKEQARGNFF